MPADAIPVGSAGLPPDAVPAYSLTVSDTDLPKDATTGTGPTGTASPEMLDAVSRKFGGGKAFAEQTPETQQDLLKIGNLMTARGKSAADVGGLPSPGFPGFQASPGTQGTLPKPFNIAEQTGSFLNSIAGANWHLAANAGDLMDSAATFISKATGLPKGGLFSDLADFARNQQQLSEREATRWAGGRQDLPTQVFRGIGTGVGMIPTYLSGAGLAEAVPGLATGLLGPGAASMGAIGALENADKGWKAVLQGAAEGTLMGKFMDVIGPLNKPYRLTGAALYAYAQAKLHGADDETAIANAGTMGSLGILGEPGRVGAKEIAQLRGRIFRPPLPGPAQHLIETANQYDIPVTAGDISQHAGLKRAEIALEDVPGAGMQSLRAKQSEAAKTAARGIQEQYRQGLLDTDPSSIEDLQGAAQGGDQRARNVLERIQNAGDDPDRLIQASIGLQDWTTRQTAKELYDKVQNLAEKNDLGDVPMNETGKAISGSLQQLRPAKLPNNEVIGLLQKVKQSISPKLDEQGNPLLDAQGSPVSPNNSYALIRQLHSDLGERIREYYQGNNALIGEKGVGYLERVHNALEDDMRNYAENSGVPEIVDAGRAADQYYRSARVPFKNGMLAAAATSTEPDSIWQQFIKSGKGDRARNFYEALDEKGRAAVRYNMVRQAVEDAINPTSGVFSPQKFFSQVEKLKEAYGVFFNSQDLREITGFKNLMGHIVRAGQYAENPPTGQRTIPFILAGGIPTAIAGFVGQPAAATASAAGTVGLIGMARALFTTEGGRRLLLKAAGMKPGTPIMENYWKDVAQQATRQPPPEEPPDGPPGGGGGAPPEAPPGTGGAEPTETPSVAEQIKGAVKKLRGSERGALTLGDLRKADLAAGSEQSTRVPTAVKATEDPLSDLLTTGYQSWTRDPEMLRKNVNAMLDYPNFGDLRDQVKSGALSIPDVAEQIIGRIQENLQWLHDAMPEEFRDRARLWYDGAHTIAHKWAGDYGATPEQVAATMAVTSPGTDWFVNAERARRLLEFWQDRDSKVWDPRMAATWRDKLSQALPENLRASVYRRIRGKSFSDLSNNPRAAAIWFRLYDEAMNPREYPTLTPEGKAGDLARVGSGEPRQFSWSDFGQIEKGLSILEDGSRENIHEKLGQQHKVRNFYNNIINPDSPREHTTIDTHAVAAALMRPLSQMSTEVGHNFGGTGSSSSSLTGESGTYGLHKEAYRRAAAANGLLPREMQSITWEAIRSMFSPQFKGNRANVEYINSLWRDVSSGKITADAARQRALEYGGGFDRPAWFKGRWNPGTPEGTGGSGKSR